MLFVNSNDSFLCKVVESDGDLKLFIKRLFPKWCLFWNEIKLLMNRMTLVFLFLFGSLLINKLNNNFQIENLEDHAVELLSVGDKFLLTKMKRLAEKFLTENLSLSTVLEVVAHAYLVKFQLVFTFFNHT